MRVMFIIGSLGVGGEQRVMNILANQFVENGHTVDVLSLHGSKSAYKYVSKINLQFLNAEKCKFKNIRKVFEIRNKIKENKPDIIVTFAIIPNILGVIANMFSNIPIIICERNDPAIYKLSWKVIRRCLYNFADGAVFQTRDALKYFDKWLKIKKELIPNPLNPSIHSCKNVDKQSKKIVSVGRLVEAKNHQLLIKAFSKIHYKFNDYIIEIYGDGPLKEQLEHIINSKELRNKVFLKGETTDIYKKIADAQIFVLSSNHEGFPNALVEALSLGIPSIATNCRIGGPKDIIEDGVNGILIEVNAEDQLIEKLEILLKNDEYRKELSNNALKIKEKLDVKVIYKQWEKFLLNL